MNPTSQFVASAGAPPQYANTWESLQGYGTVAAYRQAYALPFDTQIVIDRIPVTVGVERLRLVMALMKQKLFASYPNWLSIPYVLSEKLSRSGEAIDTFELDVRVPDGRQDRLPVQIPLYATVAGFSMGRRMLAIAERVGQPVETTEGEERIRRIQEKIESNFVFGKPELFNGYPVYGLLNGPGANTLAYVSSLAWDDVTKTGQAIFNDINGQRGVLQADGKYGPYILVVGTAYSNILDNDFKANGSLSIRQRLLGAAGINGIEGLVDIVTVDRMPKDKTVLFQATPDVIRVLYGQEPTIISWQEAGPMSAWKFMAVACMVPQVRNDYEGNSGIVIGNPT